MTDHARHAILFDFFGTLVEYQPDRALLASPESHELAQSLGFGGGHDEFVTSWDAASIELERTARQTLVEFSMTDAAWAFAEHVRLDLTAEQAAALGLTYVREWSRHVHPIAGAADMIERLAERFDIAIVSNTHDPDMVPTMLDEMGMTDHVSTTMLSVEHGRLKPHPSIYTTSLERLQCPAEHAVFVGDSYDADYAGPIEAGMTAMLIDPMDQHPVTDADRITSVLEVEARLDSPRRAQLG